MSELKRILIERDGMSPDEADAFIADEREMALSGEYDPEEILYDDFGLEPDYVFDLLGF